MGHEIERKFLLRSDAWRAHADGGTLLRQGYLAFNDKVSVRVRIAGEDWAWLTIKSAGLGLARQEFEYEIPVPDAVALIELCEAIVEKTRFKVRSDDGLWEVDVFHGANAGLVTAEIELASAEDRPQLPDWLGREVTGLEPYSNQALAEHPFTRWSR